MSDSKEIKTYDVGLGLIELNKPQHKGMSEYKPVELYHKTDGIRDNKPSFVLVLRDCSTFMNPKPPVCGQFTLETLNEALKEFGYQIKNIEELGCDTDPVKEEDGIKKQAEERIIRNRVEGTITKDKGNK